MRFYLCLHHCGFPRRWPEFEGNRAVDVQTCARCGMRRESPVQFGPVAAKRHDRDAPLDHAAGVRA